MDLYKNKQIIKQMFDSGTLSVAEYEITNNKIEQVRQETVAHMMEKLEETQRNELYQAFDKELAQKDTKAAKRPCFNGLDKYTTQQLKEELRRRKGK